MDKTLTDPQHWLRQAKTAKPKFTKRKGSAARKAGRKNVAVRTQELDLAQFLLAMRTSAGLTQQELATKLGKSRPAITQAETRPLANCSLGLITQYANACGYSFNPAKAIEPI